MVVSGVELIMSRRQIKEMIDSDPIEVQFRRRAKIPTPSGGYKLGPEAPLDLQKVRLIPFKRRMTDFLVNTELGELSDLPYVLLGFHTLDCQKGDVFNCPLGEFEVKTFDIGEPEVKRAFQVDYYGGEDNA